MPDRNDIDVFVSYAHRDRDRVRPFVERLKRSGLVVWWDQEIDIGSKWRDVIRDRLFHAKSVCVVWSAASTDRDFVRDEAQYAQERGILVPVSLDGAAPPLGFGEIKFASLANPATVEDEMERIISRIRHLSEEGVDILVWQNIDNGTSATRRGAQAADRFLEDVRARSDILRNNPGSERALRDALRGVSDTYQAVLHAIDEFLKPFTHKTNLDIDQYRSIATGRMVREIEQKRGHCKRIVQVYVESGGIRESLPLTVSTEAKDALDELMSSIQSADNDLFGQMVTVGSVLAKEAGVIVNLLLAEQLQLAQDHLRQCAAKLIPLEQELNQGMSKVDHLIVDLGIDV